MIGGKGETEVHVRAVCLAGGKGFTYSDEGSVTYTLTGPFLCAPASTKIYFFFWGFRDLHPHWSFLVCACLYQNLRLH